MWGMCFAYRPETIKEKAHLVPLSLLNLDMYP